VTSIVQSYVDAGQNFTANNLNLAMVRDWDPQPGHQKHLTVRYTMTGGKQIYEKTYNEGLTVNLSDFNAPGKAVVYPAKQ
jgi:hypothetical protein